MKRSSAYKALVFLLPMLVIPSSAFAGKGKMTQQQPNGEVHVTMYVHLAFPPSPAQLTEIKTKLRKGVRTICDATEGKVLVNDIVLGHNGQSADDADVLWYAGNYLGRYNSRGDYYGADDARVRVDDGAQSRTIAHELGHALFGLRDQYNRQRDNNNGTPQCGYGPSVEKPLTGTNSSMMQEYYHFCSEVGFWTQPVSPLVYCNSDADCTAQPGGEDWHCSEFTEISSEFNRPAIWETVIGDGALFPGPLPGEKLWLSLRFYNDVAIGPTDWNRGYKWNDLIRDTGQELDVYGIEFVDALGKYDDGSRHFVYLRVQKNAMLANTYDLQASVDDDDFASKLLWIVNGVDDFGVPQVVQTDTLQLLKAGASGCGPDPADTLNYPVSKVAGLSDASVQLKLLGSQLGNGLGDVTLDVDLQDVCFRDSTDPGEFALNEGTFDPTTGQGSGTYIGRTAPPGQGIGLSNDAVYQQLYDCEASDAGTRWRGDRQQFAESYAYEWWNNEQDAIYDTLEADCLNEPDGCGIIVMPSTASDSDILDLKLGRYWPVLAENAGDSFDPINLNLGEQIVSEPPVACTLFQPVINDAAIADVDYVAMLVDRSGSMASEWTHMGDSRPRYEWARAAVTAFGRAGETATLPMFVRFATFNDEEPDPGPYFGKLTTDAAVNPRVTSSQLRTMATVQPQGGTAIGGAVQYAFENMFDDPDNTGNAVYVLTDGENNTGPDPADVAQLSDIPVFVAPIGEYDPETTTLAALANTAGGQLYSVQSADEIPANLFELRVDLRGEDLSLLQEKSSLAAGDPDRAYAIEVEPGADRLVVMVNPQHASKANWTPDFTLTGPQGESITEVNAQYVTVDADGFFSLIMMPQPSAGNWSMTLHSPGTGVPTRHQIVMAHIEHATYDAPRCRVSTSVRSVTDVLDEVTIIAEAEYQGLVGEGATFTAEVRRPDGSVVPVTMIQRVDGRAEGVFSAYSHDGIYRASVDCVVPDGANFAPGETFDSDDSDEPTEAKLVPSGFTRVGADYFVVSAGLSIWGEGNTCSPSAPDGEGDGIPDACDSDLDNDKLPNVMEGVGDFDGDGVDDLFDTDSDDDGERDGWDWVSTDPTDYRRYSFGDFNGDGVEDIVHGVSQGTGAGIWIVVKHAGESDEHWSQGTAGVLEGTEPGDEFGAAVAVGDFNGDGYDDIAVGAPGEDYLAVNDAGAVNVLYGSSTGITELGDQLWREGLGGVQGTAELGDRFGARLTTGDFNCDGFDDLVIGTPEEAISTNAEAGAVHVLYGSVGGLTSDSDLWYQGNSGVNDTSEAGDRFGDSLLVADFNNDSCSDLVIGAPREDWGGASDAGNAYALYGSATGLTTTGDWTIVQGVVAGVPEADDHFAERIWTTKLNIDEYDDLVIMVPGECSVQGEKQKGFHYINGSASGLTTSGQEWFCFTAWK